VYFCRMPGGPERVMRINDPPLSPGVASTPIQKGYPMRRLALVGAMAMAFACGSRREVTGTLVAAHPADTLVLATGSQGTSSATLPPDGRFTLSFPRAGTFRVRFVALQGGRRRILGTLVGKNGRPVSFRTNAGNIALGAVAPRDAAPASPATGDPCVGDGLALAAEGDVGVAEEADSGEEVEHDDVCGDGDHDGGDHHDGDHDGGDHDDPDGGDHHDGDHDGGDHDDPDGGD
jgi:hypothetical protein